MAPSTEELQAQAEIMEQMKAAIQGLAAEFEKMGSAAKNATDAMKDGFNNGKNVRIVRHGNKARLARPKGWGKFLNERQVVDSELAEQEKLAAEQAMKDNDDVFTVFRHSSTTNVDMNTKCVLVRPKDFDGKVFILAL